MSRHLLKRAAASRPSGEWRDDDYDYDVLVDGVVVDRIFKSTRRRRARLGCGRSHSDTRRLHADARLRAARPRGGVREKLTARVAMAKTTTTLTAQERVILFCTATGVSHAAVGITAHATQSMAIKGFIVHDRESESYTLTDSGRATLGAILENAGLK
jgi:hypothetical protein